MLLSDDAEKRHDSGAAEAAGLHTAGGWGPGAQQAQETVQKQFEYEKYAEFGVHAQPQRVLLREAQVPRHEKHNKR